MEMFQTLSPTERVMFRQELVVAILRVIVEHFTNLEGIGLSEDELGVF